MSDLVFFKRIDCLQGAVRAVRYNVDGSYALTCGSDKKVKLWNPLSGACLKTYGGHGDEVTDAQGSCDSCHIVSSSLDKSIIYWDVTTGNPVRRLRCHAGGVTCVKFNEDSSVAISGSRDNTVMCFDIRTRSLEPIQTMRDSKDSISGIIVTDSKIITSSLDGSIRTYDIRVGEMVSDSFGESISITSIYQTKDGQCLLAACRDDAVRLVDSDTGDLLSEYTGHKTCDFLVECGILSNDSQIICGSKEGAVLWDLVSGSEIKRLDLGRVAHSLSPHPTNQDVLFATHKEIQVWGLPREEIVYL